MSNRWVLHKESFDNFLSALRNEGYQVLSPQVKAGEVAWHDVLKVSDLKQGFTDFQQAGVYRLEESQGDAWFSIVHASQSLKNLTYKPRQPVVRIVKTEHGISFKPYKPTAEKIAVIGARACDVAALQIQDKVFLDGEYQDEYFKENREALLIVAVNCSHAHETCFCDSMNTGPKVKSGFDIALTELDESFIVEVGSETGQRIVDALNLNTASHASSTQADVLIADCAASQKKKVPQKNLPDSLYAQHHSEHWDEVATRCLSCANCTMVCPTCFCHTIEETPDMARQSSERVRVWDSCFNPEHGYIHGKNMRPTTADRYRMWMTHKLGSWIDQFDSSGCTGCGRCITWCPAGIDLVEEAIAVMGQPAEEAKQRKEL